MRSQGEVSPFQGMCNKTGRRLVLSFGRVEERRMAGRQSSNCWDHCFLERVCGMYFMLMNDSEETDSMNSCLPVWFKPEGN